MICWVDCGGSAVKLVDRLPSAALIGLGDEPDAVGVLENQRLGHAARHAVGRAGEGLREALEIGDQRGEDRRVHAAQHAGVARDGRVALGHRVQRERAVAVALERFVPSAEIEVLVLQRVGELVRQDHVVQLGLEFGRLAGKFALERAVHDHHGFLLEVVERDHLAFEQTHVGGLEIDPRRIQSNQRAGAAVGVDRLGRVFALQFRLQQLARLFGAADNDRDLVLELEQTDFLDGLLDRGRLLFVDLAVFRLRARDRAPATASSVAADDREQ